MNLTDKKIQITLGVILTLVFISQFESTTQIGQHLAAASWQVWNGLFSPDTFLASFRAMMLIILSGITLGTFLLIHLSDTDQQ